MVRGIEKFKEYFSAYTGQYTFIGGTACDILLGNMGEDFRATKDFDVVLLIEALNDDFVNTFIFFVEAGGYEPVDLKSIGIRNISYNELLEVIAICFGIGSSKKLL